MFSELVDRAVHIAGRPDCLADITYFANETMRDISKRDDWPDDLIEEEAAVPPGQPHLEWKPTVGRARFRREEYIVDGCGCEPTAVNPSRRMQKLTRLYYRSGDAFIFKGCCSPIKIAYYAYQPWLQYFPANARPAEFSTETNSFGTATDAAVDMVSNWLLERHNNVILQGTLAKFFSSKQDPRQQVHYSAYEQGITHIIRSESNRELLGGRRG
jgi:hypothetical protein